VSADIRGELSERAQFACVDVVAVAFRKQEHEHPRRPDLAQHDPALPVSGQALLPDVAAEIDAPAPRQSRIARQSSPSAIPAFPAAL
jgi:hypothetical protein